MRSYTLEAFVLKRQNIGEADKLVTLFTPKLGKLVALAKGVRKIKSRRSPHLELFNLTQITLHQGKTLDVITEAKVIDSLEKAKSNLKLSGYLFYLAEVLDKILPERQPHPETYQSLRRTINSLDSAEESEGKVKEFIVQLFWDLGYLPKDHYPDSGVTDFVESIVERKIKSRKFLEQI